MIAKSRRDVPHSQPPLFRAIIFEPGVRRLQLRRMLGVPMLMLSVYAIGRIGRVKVHRVQSIAMRVLIVGLQVDRALIGCQRGVQVSQIFKCIAEVVLGF